MAVAGGTLIGSLLLWDTLFRSQLGFSVSFLEEMWSRNIANLLISPLRPLEFVAALMTMSIVRLAIGLVPVTLLAQWFFGFNLWGLGFVLVAFFVNLVLTSWAIGLAIAGLVLRNGMGAEGLAWSILFFVLPFACVYYPVSTLPHWLQIVAWSLPPTYVFEGLQGGDRRPCVPRRSDGRGLRDQPRPDRGGRRGLSGAARQRPKGRLAVANGRMNGPDRPIGRSKTQPYPFCDIDSYPCEH